MKKIFYNSSMPRSGSTLIQNILAQNPDIYATPTSGVLELLYGARANYSDSPEFKAQDAELMKKAFVEFCKQGTQAFYGAITEKPYVLDKSRGWGIHYDMLDTIHGNPKIICVVRDLRDIISSMEKKFRKNQHIDAKIMNWSQMTGTTTPKRVDMWMNSQPVGLAVERIAEIYRQGINQKMLIIRFEDLCLYPAIEMKKVYDYLGIPEFKHDYDNIEQVTTEDDSIYGIFGDHKIKSKLELPKSDHVKVLGQDVSDWIYNTYKWYFDLLGYKK